VADRQLIRISWSLTVEEWFYVLLPLLVALWYRVLGQLKSALIATVLVLFFIPLFLKLTVCLGHPSTLECGRWWCFALIP